MATEAPLVLLASLQAPVEALTDAPFDEEVLGLRGDYHALIPHSAGH